MTTSEHDIDVTDFDQVEISPTKTTPSSVFSTFRQTVNTENSDLRSELFDEATRLDNAGDLKGAKQRFEFILNIWPQDQNARVALAELLMSINHEVDALSILEDPDAARSPDTAELIEKINEKLRIGRKSESEVADSLSSRDRSELISTRRELKSLRSSQAQLRNRVHEREVELKRWVLTTASVTIAAFLFVIFTITTTAAPSKTVSLENVAPFQADVTTAKEVVVAEENIKSTPVEESQDEPAPTVSDAPEVSTNANQNANKKPAATEVAVGSLDKRFPARVEGTVHTVKLGDRAWALAYQYYGEHDDDHLKALLNANGDSKILSIGQALIIPPLPIPPQ
jgi:nucleoid-associated protein YgaU